MTMDTVYGFKETRRTLIQEINSTAAVYTHVQTGAELLSITNADENKVFGITFKTPPKDSTGIAHILEHSVLCGSRKYPVKEPFVELIRGSLKTFLNAFTYPDKTCYPVASQNLKDFYNLIDVYLDAVFFPRITTHTLAQEGWHYEVTDLDAPFDFKGVVFNEMKGVYSSPESVLCEHAQQSLFSNHTYGLNYGGDPEHIPELTYENFKAFHEAYYHPSNARIFFYGDDPEEERLKFLDAWLKDFTTRPVDSDVPLHAGPKAPVRIEHTYAVGEDEDLKKKHMVTVNWLFEEILDPATELGMGILEYILIGTPAAPLKKTLIDSGLGENLTGAGLEDDLRQMYFSVGLKGVQGEDTEKVQDLVLETLKHLAANGIDQDAIEAALNTVEFGLREQNTGHMPRGLILMVRALARWLYNNDPIEALAFEAPLEQIKTRVKEGRFFETLIQTYLVDNPHRTTLVLKPDAAHDAIREQKERQRLDEAKNAMDEAAIRQLVKETQTLKRMQTQPDSEEALATIPSLAIEDLDKKNKQIPIARSLEGEARIFHHDISTNGIVYLDLGMDLHTLPQALLPYVSLFGAALFEMGTEKEDYVQLLQRIGQKTGGIHPHLMASTLKDSPGVASWFFLRGKSTVAQFEDMLAIMEDLILRVKFDDRDRFMKLLVKSKSSAEAGLIPSGHHVVALRLASHFHEAGWVIEQTGGLSHLFFMRKLIAEVKDNWPTVRARLEEVRQALANRTHMIANVTIDAKAWEQLHPAVSSFLHNIPCTFGNLATWQPDLLAQEEGLSVPAQVHYVGKAANINALGYKPHGSAAVIAKYISTTWLWERVRVQGGAYGGFCRYDYRSGLFQFISYRDPNLLETLDIYDRTGRFLKELDLSDEELTKSIIGAIGDMDDYLLPDAKGYASMVRELTGETDAYRQQVREEILQTTTADFRAFGEILQKAAANGCVTVMGPASSLAGVVENQDLSLEILEVMSA